MNGAEVLDFFVNGKPAPQGSKRIGRAGKNGRPIIIDDNDEALSTWRDLVEHEGRRAWGGAAPLTSPLLVSLMFYMPRPAGHFGTGRNAGILKDSAPVWPAVKPDVDKLERAILDAMTKAGVWKDDALVCGVTKWKGYADARPAGVHIAVSELDRFGGASDE